MDPYFKKEIVYPFEGKKYYFDLGETLFSSFDIDHGTDILIRSIAPKTPPKTILDLGCGYGPIGICLADKYPHAKVTMVDRDLLAVRYSQINLQKNNINNAMILGSVGMEAVFNQTFDLIVSNIPAKIGDQAVKLEFILEPLKHLNPNGELWIVVVNALNRLIPNTAQKIRDRRGHTVYKLANHNKPF